MQRFFITILAALLIGGLATAQSFPDIPAGHWAGDAVEEIADLGIVIGFPDGTFRGNEAFTRYQSALVISRMLAVVDANMDAELGGLRAAMQELAADVAAQGVRLAAAESAIAGLSDSVAANAANVAANGANVAANAANVAANGARLDAAEARLDALESMDMSGMDEDVLRDLQNQIASQRVAIDTAQAQAEAAEARANGAYDLALQALAATDANASDIAALNQAFGLLSARVDGLGGPAPMQPAAPMVDVSGIERNAGDIANIREFVILLRRDQVALRDRVSALEAADAATAASIEGLEGRVAALEARQVFVISGSIALNYRAYRVDGDTFDIDRVYGVNALRGMGNSTFSSGSYDFDDADPVPGAAKRGGNNDPGERAQDRADITNRVGDTSATLTLNIKPSGDLGGSGSPRGLNDFSAVAVLVVRQVTSPDLLWDDPADPDDQTIKRPYVISVDSFTSTFKPIGAAPVTFEFGTEVRAKFTPYVFNFQDYLREDEQTADVTGPDGYIATVSAPDFLAFLNPGLVVAYGSYDGGYGRGIRGTMEPSFGDAITLSGGVHFVQYALNAQDTDAANNDETTVWGLDGNVGLLGILDVAFEYAQSSTNADPPVDATSVLWVTGMAGADLGFADVTLGGVYRAIDADFDGIGFGVGDGKFKPFELGQEGFGGEIGLGLFGMLDVTAFYDQYDTATEQNAGYGVEVGADLFAGFSLSGFYQIATVDGDTAKESANDLDVAAGFTLLDGDYQTKFGVGIEHDGDADNALISGLNISAGYEQYYNVDAYSRTRIYADADFELAVSIVTLTPYVGFEDDVDTVADTEDFTEISAGIGVSTQPLDIFLKPSLQAAVNYRNADYSDRQAGQKVFTSTELQWSVGLNLGEFLMPNSTLDARVGQWQGTNMTTALGVYDDGISNTDRTDSDVFRGDGVETVFGWEAVWNYYDLRFGYGMYTRTLDDVESTAQAFQIRYTVDF